MDHNDSFGNTPRNHISQIKQDIVNGCYKFCPKHRFWRQHSVCVCVHVCVCVCVWLASLHMSNGPVVRSSRAQFSASAQSEPMGRPSVDGQENWVTSTRRAENAARTNHKVVSLLLSTGEVLFVFVYTWMCLWVRERSSETVLLAESWMNCLLPSDPQCES